MKRISSQRVIVSESLQADSKAYARAHALASHIETSHREILSDAEIRQVENEMPWEKLPKRGRDGDPYDFSVVILGRMDWESEHSLFPGYHWAETRSGRYEWENNAVMCHSAVEIQSILGCSFDCLYCPYTRILKVACDLEEFVDRVGKMIEASPKQLLYKLNNRSDTLCFEPEYGLSKLLVEWFAETKQHQLMLYSKSNNVNHLLGLQHNKRTIMCFTLSSPATARLLEPGAPSFDERLEAAARCAEAGYPVRFRFSPLLPVLNWEQEYTVMVERMSKKIHPELVTLWTLSMTSYGELLELMDHEFLDPRFLEAARDSQGEMEAAKGAPFPEKFRTSLYECVTSAVAQYCPETKVSLCLETPSVIGELHPRLAIVDRVQVCNCGPQCTSEKLALASSAASLEPRTELAFPKSRISEALGQKSAQRLRKKLQAEK